MKILNIGSINIDHVYQVQHFVRAGETISSTAYNRFAGGKGCNQSIALARAGADVMHVGQVGRDGLWLKEMLAENGVNVEHIPVSQIATGHAIIQVDVRGENCILLHGGANQHLNLAAIKSVLSVLTTSDYVLLQNEVNHIADLMALVKKTGAKIIFNPAPITDEIKSYPLDIVDVFILNEVESKAFTSEDEPEKIIVELNKQFPNADIILTLGKSGVMASDGDEILSVPAINTTVVDTTAAGDTFIGYYLAMLAKGKSMQSALEAAVKAAAICVSRAGAVDSIPVASELG